MTFGNAGLTAFRTGSLLKSLKILAVANSPKVPLPFRVKTSGTSFFTSRVRRAVSGSAGLSTTTRMSGLAASKSRARSWKYAFASPLNWKKVMVTRPPSPLHPASKLAATTRASTSRPARITKPPH